MKWSQSFGFESVAGGRSAHGFVHRTGQCRRHGCGGNVEWRSHVQNCLQSSAVPMHPGGKAVRGVGKSLHFRKRGGGRDLEHIIEGHGMILTLMDTIDTMMMMMI